MYVFPVLQHVLLLLKADRLDLHLFCVYLVLWNYIIPLTRRMAAIIPLRHPEIPALTFTRPQTAR